MSDFDFNNKDKDKNQGQYYNNYGWQNDDFQNQHSDKQKKKRSLKVVAIVLCVAIFSVIIGLATVGVVGILHYGDGFVSGSAEPSQGVDQNKPSLTIIDPNPKAPDGKTDETAAGAASGSAAPIDMVTDGNVKELTIPEIAAKIKPAVVGIISKMNVQGFLGQSTGTGIVMTSDGYIITNQHVIDSSSDVKVVMENGDEYPATIVGQDSKSDLAVLKIDAKDLSFADFGNSDKVVVGELAVAVGNPMGLELAGSVTAGIISAINRDLTVEDRVMTLIQTDASINKGKFRRASCGINTGLSSASTRSRSARATWKGWDLRSPSTRQNPSSTL
jgi:serine protease Do